MRAMRKASGNSLRSVANAMSLSAAYISDLELGRRAWSDALIERFKKAVRA